MAATIWAINGGFVSLSGGNLTATSTASSTLNQIISTNTQIAGKFYWELLASTVTSDRYGIQNLSRSGFLGADTNGVGWGQDGTVYFNGSQVATWETFASGNVLRFELDLGGKTLKGKVGSGTISNSISISTFNGIGSTPIGAGGMPFTSGDVVTGRFATASWSFSPDPGYISFDPVTGGLLLTNRGIQNTGMDLGSGTIRG